ncbi:hypothetical protein CYMTET_28224 [Cymbomonas tetramitiformis]|uniref:Uncharacterized protein n=1 Tax=Cymbomonas tetramitiformis TaxID=36881 RepID=A0AAE0FNK6_9CHLO|nr:hypothetical protein CYMTET_28224 [Cymbomonas tetramitiformis]
MAESEAVACFIIPLLDLLDVHGLSRIILKHLRADYRALLGTTCTLCRDLVEDRYFLENLHFANCPKLTASTLTAVVHRAQEKGASIRQLDISCCNQLRTSWREVRSLLPALGYLKFLRMGGVHVVLDPQQATQLVSELGAVTEVLSFDLELHVGPSTPPEALEEFLSTVVMSEKSPLRAWSLDLYGKVGSNGIQSLATALMCENCKLWRLCLRLNNVGDAGAKVLAGALQHESCKLRHFTLQDNNVECEGALSIASALESRSCRLEYLNLRYNNVGDEGARSLATVLAHTSCNLRHLNLAGNNIGHEGARDLAASLESKNNTLQHLILLGNYLGPEGTESIAASLAHEHCKLQHLNIRCKSTWKRLLCGSHFSSPMLRQICECNSYYASSCQAGGAEAWVGVGGRAGRGGRVAWVGVRREAGREWAGWTWRGGVSERERGAGMAGVSGRVGGMGVSWRWA